MREFCGRVLIRLIWEKLLSTETVETGNVKPIEAIFGKLGNIVTSILFVMSTLSCNAMLSSDFIAGEVRKVIHSVCTSGDMIAIITVSSSYKVRANLSFLQWLSKTSIDFFPSGKLGRYWERYEDQIWPVLTRYHELQTGLKCFP